jgi:hypothetical protein
MGIRPWLHASWEQQFGTGSVPSEASGDYPSKAELLESLADGQRRIRERLAELGENGLAAPLPDVRFRPFFPTLGDAVLHVLTSHAGVHVGQVSVWRRVVGLGPLTEVFH